jgi:hypothetical protein
MGKRDRLQSLLESVILSKNVYFQPPGNHKLSYPCIIYSRTSDNNSATFANNMLYLFRDAYLLTLVDPNPDTENHKKIMGLPMCSFIRNFTRDNLNHYIYKIFY